MFFIPINVPAASSLNFYSCNPNSGRTGAVDDCKYLSSCSAGYSAHPRLFVIDSSLPLFPLLLTTTSWMTSSVSSPSVKATKFVTLILFSCLRLVRLGYMGVCGMKSALICCPLAEPPYLSLKPAAPCFSIALL